MSFFLCGSAILVRKEEIHMKKAVIGILTHPETDDLVHPTNYIGDRYIVSIEKAGGLPVLIPIVDDVDCIQQYIALCDGILVPGGIDVNPLCYNENPSMRIGVTDLAFDTWELHVIKQAEEKRLPILGICRGIQILNVYRGGTLWQDLRDQSSTTFQHVQKEIKRDSVSHKVLIDTHSHLHSLFGSDLMVNSFHHQAVKELGKGLLVSAKATDGTVEAIEAVDYPYMLGVQWHPEAFVFKDDSMMPLFRDFVDACR